MTDPSGDKNTMDTIQEYYGLSHSASPQVTELFFRPH